MMSKYQVKEVRPSPIKPLAKAVTVQSNKLREAYQSSLEEKLRRPVPKGDEFRRVFVLQLIQTSGQPPVRNLEMAAIKK